ncbi:MAG: B12-binding domain-containing radical SAM protein [Gaiellaceae bacterium]
MNDRPIRTLLVDLNNYARFPTLAIGYLVAALRREGIQVEVLSPLAYGLPATEREHQEALRDQLLRRAYFATHPAVIRSHDAFRNARARWIGRPNPRVVQETTRALEERKPDVLLLSAYLDHYPSIVALTAVAGEHGIPVLLGGPMFNNEEVAREWLDIPGLTAVVGAEVDLSLPELVATAVDGGPLEQYEGVFLPDGRQGPPSRPLLDLDKLPIPDFSDFPWDRYPHKIIPVMTGRGCNWGRCLFCGDVQTANGRGFRSRPLESVLAEIEEQSARYGTRDVIFLDIKLNSDVELWRGLHENFQRRLPGGQWIGTVHVQRNGDNGLSRDDVVAARRSGWVRTTFGLETGSQRVNDSMAKGTSIEGMSQFVRDASEAGVSVRTTAMLGYPGEDASDINRTVGFLREHERYLDRVRLSRFKVIPGTRFEEFYRRRPERYGSMTRFRWNYRFARAAYTYEEAKRRSYRKAKADMLRFVYRINKKPLRAGAEVFDGLM